MKLCTNNLVSNLDVCPFDFFKVILSERGLHYVNITQANFTAKLYIFEIINLRRFV